MNENVTLIHATCVALDGAGVLLCGPSGSGKSDLALRLIDGGARLVADDQVALSRIGSGLVARAPGALRGLLEVRGLGIVEMAALDAAPVVLAVDLVADDAVDRLPEARFCTLAGVAVPLVALAPFQLSAPAKVRLAAGLAKRDSSGATKAS
jgi:HPr kinase/phosphorylase